MTLKILNDVNWLITDSQGKKYSIKQIRSFTPENGKPEFSFLLDDGRKVELSQTKIALSEKNQLETYLLDEISKKGESSLMELKVLRYELEQENLDSSSTALLTLLISTLEKH